METVLVSAFTIACVLIISSISGIFNERSGIINIGIDGTMIIGGIAYVAVSNFFNSSSPWLQIPLFIICAIVGGLYASLHGIATIKLKSNQVISSIAINLLAGGLAIVITQLFVGSNYFSFKNKELAWSWSIEWKNLISLKTFILIAVVGFSWFSLNKTRWGLRFKSVGENPNASDSAGINVTKVKWQGIWIAGALSGIAGAIFATHIGSNGFKNNVAGLGFLALSIIIVSRWNVLLTVIVGMGFAFLYSLTSSTLITWNKDLLQMTPYLVTIIFLVVFSKKSNAPKAAGVPFDKSKR